MDLYSAFRSEDTEARIIGMLLQGYRPVPYIFRKLFTSNISIADSSVLNRLKVMKL